MLSHTLANIILQVVLIAILNVVIYFTYTTYIENKIVVTESQRIVQDLTDDLRIALPNTSLATIRTKLYPYLTVPDLSSDDEEVKTNNKDLVVKSVKIFITALLCCLIIVLAMSIYFKINLKSLLLHNLSVLVAVAVIEIIFLTVIVQNYISIDSNFVKVKLIETLQAYLKS